jgi:hypothetical protein
MRRSICSAYCQGCPGQGSGANPARQTTGTRWVDLTEFLGFLQAKAGRLFNVPAGHATHLDTLITVSGQHLRLTLQPEQIVFIEG